MRIAINEALDLHEDAANQVANYLASMGYMERSHCTSTTPKKTKSEEDALSDLATENNDTPQQDTATLAVKDEKCENDPSMSHRVRMNAGITDEDPNNWIPHKYTKFSNSSLAFLKTVLGQIEEVALAEIALRPVVSRGTIAEKTDRLCDYIEFTCGMSRDLPFTGSSRHIPSLIKEMKQRNIQRGRRARDKRCPINFSKDGVFGLEEQRGILWVYLQGDPKVRLQVPDAKRLKYDSGSFVEMGRLRIESNFNEKQAIVVSDVVGARIDICSLGQFSNFDEGMLIVDSSAMSPVTPNVARLEASVKAEQGSAAQSRGGLEVVAAGVVKTCDELAAVARVPSALAQPVGPSFDELDFKPEHFLAKQMVKEAKTEVQGELDEIGAIALAAPSIDAEGLAAGTTGALGATKLASAVGLDGYSASTMEDPSGRAALIRALSNQDLDDDMDM